VSTLQIDLDQDTSDALASLAAARGTAPADLVAEIIARIVDLRPGDSTMADQETMILDALVGRYPEDRLAMMARSVGGDASEQGLAPPDPIDALVGSIDSEPVDDIDEVIYGR
jgi:hypothetical protein